MTEDIQKELKGVLALSTDLPGRRIYLSHGEEGQIQAAPWASILPGAKALRPVWQWDSWIFEETVVKVRRKYDAFEPFFVKIRRERAGEVSRDVEAFLEALPRSLIIGGALVRFVPIASVPYFGMGAMDVSTADLEVRAEYGVYAREDLGRIKEVLLAVKEKFGN